MAALLVLLVMVAFTFGYSTQASDEASSSSPAQFVPVEDKTAQPKRMTLLDVSVPESLAPERRPAPSTTASPAPQPTSPAPAAPAPAPSRGFDSVG